MCPLLKDLLILLLRWGPLLNAELWMSYVDASLPKLFMAPMMALESALPTFSKKQSTPLGAPILRLSCTGTVL